MEYDPIEILDDEALELDDDDVQFIAHRQINQPHLRPTRIITSWGDVQFLDGTLMRVTSYERDDRGQIQLTGYNLVTPTIHTHCMDSAENELVWQQQFTKDYSQLVTETTRPASDVLRNCQIVFTNQLYDVINYNNDLEAVPGSPLFFCRWKRTLPHLEKLFPKPNGASRHPRGSIELLRSEEADEGSKLRKDGTKISTRISNTDNRAKLRGQTMPGGSTTFRSGNQFFGQYTFGDCFSGAGGTSQGAYDAGFRLQWAFDFNREAMASYKNRFGDIGVECLLEDCTQFLQRIRAYPERYKVDIVHLSPPCKPFSAANTTPNEETNAINHAVFTVVEDIIREIKPRIVTLEQADALEWPSRRPWFVKVLSMFTGLGYSVRFEVMPLSIYGVPQSRKRLIIIGSCPGEKLPFFPMPTHGTAPHQHPPPSIAQALQNVPRRAPHHNPAAMRRFSIPRPPLDDSRLSGTIKCGGNSGNVYFPDGTRGYTVREMATLQTFPINFVFKGTNGQKTEQIGNAVPPWAAAVLFSEIRNSLLQADKEEM